MRNQRDADAKPTRRGAPHRTADRGRLALIAVIAVIWPARRW